ncbi:MAG TPA: NACHT domain-containing protein, partial [Anaerolineae bacterium]|nr:NACHT domain-containing protein [Anaerolineae bacterium]
MNPTDVPDGIQTAIFTRLVDGAFGGVKKAFGWGWDRIQWAEAQDRYEQRIIEDHSRIRILGQTGTRQLQDIFTDVYVLDRPTALRRLDPAALSKLMRQQDRGQPLRHGERRPVETLLQEADKLLILGRPGAGKTTLLKYLAVREAQRGKWGQCLGKLPIFVPLRQMSDAGQEPLAFIADQFTVCHFPEAAPFVDQLLRSGKALVLFDGLDEVPHDPQAERSLRGEMIETLERFARQYEKCHIVITCRIAATEYTFGPAFTYLELADFDQEQVETFVRRWFWDEQEPGKSDRRAEQMLTELQQAEHRSIRDLTRNPLLLTLLCLTYEETLSFPARRVEIYEEALGALLKKWDASRGIRRRSLYGRLSPGRKEQMFARIAYDAFIRGDLLFARRDLEAWIKAYLVHVPEMPDAVDIDGEAVLREIVAQHGIFAEQARD